MSDNRNVKMYQHQFTEEELDQLIEYVKLDAVIKTEEYVQRILQNLEITRYGKPISNYGLLESGLEAVGALADLLLSDHDARCAVTISGGRAPCNCALAVLNKDKE